MEATIEFSSPLDFCQAKVLLRNLRIKPDQDKLQIKVGIDYAKAKRILIRACIWPYENGAPYTI